MENALSSISPVQMLFLAAIQIWFYIIFPVIVLRKLNYLTELVHNQFEENEDEVLPNDEPK